MDISSVDNSAPTGSDSGTGRQVPLWLLKPFTPFWHRSKHLYFFRGVV